MVVRYFDKDGKEHRLNLKSGQPVFIASEIGNTGEYAEFRLHECKSFNKSIESWTTAGKIELSAASNQGMAIYPKGNGSIEIGPAGFDPKNI